MKDKFKTMGLLAIGLGSILGAASAQAHVACRINGPFGTWTEGCPHFHAPDPGSNSSCLSVVSQPQEYSFEIRNGKTYTQRFKLGETRYTLEAGETKYFTTKVGYSGSSSCNQIRIPEPVIEFDRYRNDGQYTGKKFTVDVTNHANYLFWLDGDTIKFSKD